VLGELQQSVLFDMAGEALRAVSEYGLYGTYRAKFNIFHSFISTNMHGVSWISFVPLHPLLFERDRHCLGSPASHTFSPLGSSRPSFNAPETAPAKQNQSLLSLFRKKKN